METKQYVWRGTYGDTEPVRVHMTQALDFYGGLEAEHFESEEAAWGNILACVEADVTAATEAQQRALAEYDHARRELVSRRRHYNEICTAFDAWKARYPKAAAV